VAGLERALAARGHAVELHWTTGPGDAARRARGAEAGLDRLVVAGGDGTLNEVLNGLPDPSRLPLSLLPLGTANLLARELGLPRRPRALAEIVDSGRVRRLDLGRIGSRLFLALVSCGFDAMVVHAIQRGRRGRLGYRGYLAPILRTLRDYRPPALEVTLDGSETVAASLAVVSHVRNYGGLFSVTDRARPDSGVFDVCLFPHAARRDLVRYALAGLARRMTALADVVYRRARHVRLAASEPVPIEVDGDAWGTTPAEIELEPARVPFVVPAGGTLAES
jgi:YegS/Rv2252/BmrU family lipid kinase